MKRTTLIGGVAALLLLAAANKEKSTKSSKVFYAEVEEPAPNDHTPSDGGSGGSGTPV